MPSTVMVWPVLIDGGAGDRADDGGHAELAGDDRAVRQHAADIGDDGAGDREQRHPRRQRHLAHHDLALLERVLSLRERAHDAGLRGERHRASRRRP